MTIIDEEMRKRMRAYNESTAGVLDHYFGNTVSFMGDYLNSPVLQTSIREIERETQAEPLAISSRREFYEGLQEKLDAGAPELEGVTHDHLREMIAIAQGDWDDVNTIKALYQRYSEIRKTNYDLEKLFEQD